MNLIDAILIFVVLLSIWAAWRTGFIISSINLLVWLGSLAAGLYGYSYVGKLLQSLSIRPGVWLLPISFIMTVIIVRILLSMLMTRILKSTPESAQRSPMNHLLGIVPGFVNGLIYAVFIAAVLLSMPLNNEISNQAHDSRIADRLSLNVVWLDSKLSPIFSDALNKSLSTITVEPGSNETVHLHFKYDRGLVRPDLEKSMLVLINEERVKRGIRPLKPDSALSIVARSHSDDMFRRGYFSHYTPEGKDPFDRMKEYNIHFLTAGENLALGQTLNICHEGLMNSPGHRANILNPAYGRVGIGILDGGIYGLMISQEFRN